MVVERFVGRVTSSRNQHVPGNGLGVISQFLRSVGGVHKLSDIGAVFDARLVRRISRSVIV